MANLKEVKITDEDGKEISIWMDEGEESRGSRSMSEKAINQLANLQDTIKTFTHYTLTSFQQVANANIDKVTLEFGINVGGEAGIPYITKGSVGSNIKISVECSFPKNTQPTAQ
jgi:hypothetical protein